jgi:hypothetical protein
MRCSTCVRFVHHLIDQFQPFASLLHALRHFTEQFMNL